MVALTLNTLALEEQLEANRQIGMLIIHVLNLKMWFVLVRYLLRFDDYQYAKDEGNIFRFKCFVLSVYLMF